MRLEFEVGSDGWFVQQELERIRIELKQEQVHSHRMKLALKNIRKIVDQEGTGIEVRVNHHIKKALME